MIQFPKDLLPENQHVKLKMADMYGIAIFPGHLWNDNSILQTAHCLEMILEGTIKVKYRCESQILSKGSIQFRKRGNYELYPSADYSSLMIFMESEFIQFFLKQHVTIFNNIRFNSELLPFTFKVTDFIQLNILHAVQHITCPEVYSACIVKHTAHQILLQLLAQDQSKTFVSFLRYLVSQSRMDLGYFMEANFTQQLTVKELAKLTGRSLSAFKKEFVKDFNTTPIKWQISRRLEYAEYLITNTSDPISTIAYSVGFENLSHFSKIYKDKFGSPPTKTRHL